MSFTNPANGATVAGTINVSLAASGGTGTFSEYRVAVDGTNVFTGAGSAFSWNTTTVPDGAHTLTATVTDSAGTTASTSVSVTVQQGSGGGGSPLAVYITGPTQGQVVSGSQPIDIWVENATGSSNTFVTKVDGATIDTQTISGVHATVWPWNTTTVGNGTHTVSATVTDSSGRTATTSITVTVSN